MHTRLLLLALVSLTGTLRAAESLSAKELAARLDALRPMGSTLVRMRMETSGAPKAALQIAVKERRSASSDEVAWQILWPKDRSGETAILQQRGGRTTANLPLEAPLFGSALAVADAIENFYAWKNQTLAGTEPVNGTACVILESKPGAGDSSIYSRVRSWVDTRRLVPLRVEKYTRGGELARRIETTRVVMDNGRAIPANLSIHDVRNRTTTDVDGSRIQHDAAFTDADFAKPSR
jgi:outer membrane lipoprotein-sorting protein